MGKRRKGGGRELLAESDDDGDEDAAALEQEVQDGPVRSISPGGGPKKGLIRNIMFFS